MNIHLNNVGDPFIEYARDYLHPNHPKNYWGYVLNMGSTEGR